MGQNLTDLTEKLFQEGLKKGEAKAQELIADANKKAEQIVADAEKKAAELLAQVKREGDELKKTIQSEIQLAGQKALALIKQKILDIFTDKPLEEGVGRTLSDPVIIKDIILELVKKWDPQGKGDVALEVVLPENKRNDLEQILAESLGQLKQAKHHVSFSHNMRAGMQLGPQGGAFKVSLTDDDFVEFLKDYFRPKAKTLLFGE